MNASEIERLNVSVLFTSLFWPDIPKTAPWRDPTWRKLAKQYLGEHAPNDPLPLSEIIYESQRKGFEHLPSLEREQAELQLLITKSELISDDNKWSQWYSQLDRQRKTAEIPDFAAYVQGSLMGSLQATAMYLTISLFLLPEPGTGYVFAFVAGGVC
jgi:hypothetical protein